MARNWKKMSKEEEDKKRQETIDKAIETMNKGIYEYLDSDRFKTLLDTMSKFHDYSMNNTLLILGQNPRATHLAGYNKWQQDFNRQVKRGEKGLMIWMPVEIKVKEKQYVLDENGNRILGDDGKFKKEEVEVKKHTFKIGYTFDVSQTEQIEGIVIKMKTPLRTINVDSVNPVGRVNFNRMYKRINDMRYSLNKTIETIQNYEGNLKIAKEMVNEPFELQDELTSARNRQKEINKILDTSGNENSKVVVEDDLEEERNESCMEL